MGLSAISNAIVRLFGVDPTNIDEKHTAEDLKQIIDSSRLGGTLDPGEAGCSAASSTCTSRRRAR